MADTLPCNSNVVGCFHLEERHVEKRLEGCLHVCTQLVTSDQIPYRVAGFATTMTVTVAASSARDAKAASVQPRSEGTMASVGRFVRLSAMCAALFTVGCGGDDSDTVQFPVTSAVVSDSTTQDIHVFAPNVEGTWPMVVALHGIEGTGLDMGELATRLAGSGTVVFAPTYRSDLTTLDGFNQASQDIVCGYQLARTIAPQYGGNLSQPVTAVGWSLGADFVVLGGLSPATAPSADDPCPDDETRPDVIVGISGCYYENEGKPVTWFDDVSTLGNKSADIYLLAGDRDARCPAWQSEKLSRALQAAGYHVELVELTGADHYAPVFHEVRNGQFKVKMDEAAGQRAVEVIMDAIDRSGTP